MTDIAALAAALTVAQRKILRGRVRHIPIERALSLPLVGLIERMPESHLWKFSDLGLAVRSHIIAQGEGHD